ncbi:MAG: NHL repeat-containing protein [Anaerolineales bacterium]|jgi:sugar lactone lactonase YvrE
MKFSRLLLLVMIIGLAACNAEPVPPTPAPTIPPTPSPTAAAPAALTASPTPTLTATTPPPTSIPQVNPNPRQVVLAANLNAPDDLALAPDGSIYISDINEGTVTRLTPDGQLLPVVSGLNIPEGILVLPDGTLIIAEQGGNRLDHYDPTTNRLTPFVRLVNETTQDGVDGITLDSHDPQAITIIIPDSPNGTLLRASLDGQRVTLITKEFTRPTDAWVEPDGSILVVDEDANSLSRVHPDGTIDKLAGLPTPDDVVEDQNGNIFVTTLGDGAVHLISAATQQDTILVGGLINPQGLILDQDGNLVVADAGHHQLVKLVLH